MGQFSFTVALSAVCTLGCCIPSSDLTTPDAQTSPRVSVGTAPGTVGIVDLNGDRTPDIVVANEQGNNVTTLLGDGKGGFTQAKGSPFPAGHRPNDIALGDFNRDGKVDAAFANHEEKSLTVLLGDGQGGFRNSPHSPFAVEVRPHAHGVATGDVNGDGNLDLVTESWGTDQVVVLFGDGKGGFRLPGAYYAVGKHPYQRARVADVNGDGKSDIVTTNLEGDNVTVLLGAANGRIKEAAGSPFPCGDSPFNLAIGDLNGDGKLDLAIVNSPGSTADRVGKEGLTILLGDGEGGFKTIAGAPFVTGKIPNLVAVGDVNGDGVGDVAVSSPDGGNVTLFVMNRSGVASSITSEVGGRPKGLAIGDLNNDGHGDVVVTNNSENTVTVILSR